MRELTSSDPADLDVLVIGGGAAGLNGALQLVRQRRRVLVLDAGHPRNAPAAHAHGMLGHDGINPLELLQRGRAEIESYGGLIRRAEVADARAEGEGFVVTTADGITLTARRLLIASGVTDRLPEIPGLAERWGRDVVHCPYCHGWEVRDTRIVVIGSTPGAAHQALLFSQLSSDVTLVDHGAAPEAEQARLLTAAGVRSVDGPVARVLTEADAITGVLLADGTTADADTLTVQSRAEITAPFLAGLGLVPQEHPSGMGSFVPSGLGGATDVPGVHVAGNVTDLSAQVGAAAAQGAMAGAVINADLVMKDAAART